MKHGSNRLKRWTPLEVEVEVVIIFHSQVLKPSIDPTPLTDIPKRLTRPALASIRP